MKYEERKIQESLLLNHYKGQKVILFNGLVWRMVGATKHDNDLTAMHSQTEWNTWDASKNACDDQNWWRAHRNSNRCRKIQKSSDSMVIRRLYDRLIVLMQIHLRRYSKVVVCDHRNLEVVASARAHRESIRVAPKLAENNKKKSNRTNKWRHSHSQFDLEYILSGDGGSGGGGKKSRSSSL